jgi:2-amino-4-hydroxy-6-hydroxymethyldihydropteridine diphosphokinase
LKTVYLALGSNLGDRESHLRRAIAELRSPGLEIVKVSAVYETAPQGFLEQGWFLNLVVEAATVLFPMQLLKRCQRVERLMKRQRQIANGPRTIDIDILFYGTAMIQTRGLEVPHPRYRERRFVLEPLAGIAPDLKDPVTKRGVREMLSEVMDQKVTRTPILISP